jgi:hypothetical protein
MRKAMLLSAAITLCAGLALAQDTPSNGASNQNGATTSTTTQTTTTDQNAGNNNIQGCLTGTPGNYMLTDAAGMSYKVQGDESQLSSNVNKQVEVMGTVGSSASASASNNNNADTNAPNSSSASGQPNQGGNPDASGAGGASTGASATATASKTLNATSVKMVADSCSNNK